MPEIIYRKLKDLKLLERNPRQIGKPEFDTLCKSLIANPDYFEARPLILSDRTGELVVIAGNMRHRAAKHNKQKEVPTILLSGLTQEREAEIIIRDNVNNGSWDFDLVANEWSDYPLSDWGLDVPDYEAVEEAGTADAEPQIDKAAELNKKWKVKSGDLWLIGEHRLKCGDSTNSLDIDDLMRGDKAQMVFTDPPYGMFLDTSNSKRIAPKGNWSNVPKDYGQVIGDNEDFKPELIETIFSYFADVDEVFIWGVDYFAELIPDRVLGAIIVWDKRASVETVEYTGSHFELCWSKQKHNRDMVRVPWFGLIGTEQEHDQSRQHPTQKPTALAKWFLDKYSKKGETIVDLYAGSGFSLIASENLERKCRAMELSPEYVSVCLERMQTAFPDIEIKRDA